jgi:ABC-type Fe3+ transport system substrate-binding protein
MIAKVLLRFSASERASTVMLMAMLATACGEPAVTADSHSRSAAPSHDLCAGSQPGSQVVVYSTPGLDYWYADVLFAFQTDCGVSIFYASLPSAQILPRLEGEAKSPLADIVVAPPPYITEVADKGLLDGTAVPGASSVPSDRCDAQRRWCAVAETYASWVYNPARVSSPPARWNDLLAARFQQLILTSRADQALDGLALIVLLEKSMGESGAFNYLRQLERSVSAHYVVSDTMSRLVAAGSDLAADGDLQESLNDVDQYHNLAIWFPSPDGTNRTTLAIPYGAALVHGGPNRANAKALLTFLWSDAAQGLVAQSYGSPARPEVVQRSQRAPRVSAALVGLHILRIDWEQVVRDQSRLTSEWLALRTAPDGTAAPSTPIPLPSLSPPP